MKSCFVSWLEGIEKVNSLGVTGDIISPIKRRMLMPKGIYVRKSCDKKTIVRLRLLAFKKRKPNNCLCLECGKGFKKKPFAISKGEGKYCSLLCRNNAFRKTYKGRGNPQYGQHWGIGKNNPNWKGGKSRNGYTWDWPSIKTSVKERDEYTCKICGIKNGEKYKRSHGVHHKDGDKKNNLMKNLITICVGCHCKVHKPYLNSPMVKKANGGGVSNTAPF